MLSFAELKLEKSKIMKIKKFEIYLKDSMYIEESESMIDAILKFAMEYPCILSEIIAVIEQCDDSTWIKRNNDSECA